MKIEWEAIYWDDGEVTYAVFTEQPWIVGQIVEFQGKELQVTTESLGKQFTLREPKKSAE